MNQPIDLDAERFINEVALHAIFDKSIDVPRLRQLIEQHHTQIAAREEEIVHLRTRVQCLEIEIAQARQEIAAAKKNATGSTFQQANLKSQDLGRPAKPGAPRAVAPLPNIALLNQPSPAEQARELGKLLGQMLEKPEIKLPVLPQIGVQVQKLIARDDCTFDQIADMVGLDASMSARILEVANSPLYAGVEQIRNLQHAVSRIGLRETRNILQAVAAENLFKASDKRLTEMMKSLWMHSLACAYSNEILARFLSIPESEDFFMMGLLHDIGKLLIIQMLQQAVEDKIWSRDNVSEEMLLQVMQTLHNPLGLRLMQKWGYPEAFHNVISQHNNDDKVQEFGEPVVVTYFSNLLTRKMGFSLLENDEALLNRHEIAQALNMDSSTREKIEKELEATVSKIGDSFF